MKPIKMVDLHSQYLQIKPEIDQAIQDVLTSTNFIQGNPVKHFEASLSSHLKGADVISCGNGTDALQIAMMALDFRPGDEVILPVYTYVATAEVIALLNLVPVFVDVDEHTFNIDVSQVEKLITKKTVAIVPVHLFGQCADMDQLMTLAHNHKLHVIEDAAQSLGSRYTFENGETRFSGSIGTIGTTSFFPTKNLGAFGDGGAVITNDHSLSEKIRMIANHGQRKKYYHDIIGVNSRLDTIQAAILDIKLKHLNLYEKRRNEVADFYDSSLKGLSYLKTPYRNPQSTHVFHQYTVVLNNTDREQFRNYLQAKGIPTMIYYPEPLHFQKAYKKRDAGAGSFPVSEKLAASVVSLPIHTEMDNGQLAYICDSIKSYTP